MLCFHPNRDRSNGVKFLLYMFCKYYRNSVDRMKDIDYSLRVVSLVFYVAKKCSSYRVYRP